jgi:hypothetical protein
MLRTPLFAALGLVLLMPAVSAQAHFPAVSDSPTVIEAQWPGWEGDPGYAPEWAVRRAKCEQMRQSLHEIGDRMQYAPPWERGRMAARFYHIRGNLRHECWRGW